MSPSDMFGKVMSIPDSLMENYFTLTDLPTAEIKALVDPAHTPRSFKGQAPLSAICQQDPGMAQRL